MATTVQLTPAAIVAERGLPPIGSVWKYRQGNYITEERRKRFGPKALTDVAEAIIEVRGAPALRYGYLLDVYLRFNSRQGGFDYPRDASMEAGRKLTHLAPHEFWGFVDQGFLEQIGGSED